MNISKRDIGDGEIAKNSIFDVSAKPAEAQGTLPLLAGHDSNRKIAEEAAEVDYDKFQKSDREPKRSNGIIEMNKSGEVLPDVKPVATELSAERM